MATATGIAKRQYVQIGKTTTLHVNHAFCTFLAVTARLRTFYEAREHMKTIFFVIFQNQDTVLQDQLQKHFRQHFPNEMKWNKSHEV